MSTATELPTYTLGEVERIILGAVTQQSERDKQTKLGPSEVGGCPYCVAYTMRQKLPNPPPKRGDDFGYAAWIGTAAHYWLEHHLPERLEGFTAIPEVRLEIGEISDYGMLTGSNDLYVRELQRTFDWKFPGKYSYEKVKMALRKRDLALKRGDEIDPRTMLPSTQYRYQQQLYAHGQRLLGNPVTHCVIVFFPRHTNNINDVTFYEEPYSEEMVTAAFDRAEAIWEDVKDGELENIPSDPDCFQCDVYGR